MKIGGIEIIDGKLGTLVLETIPTAPTFDAAHSGEFTFSEDDKILRFNTGNTLVALNSGASENPNLVESLGENWLNVDYTFNPVPFNNLPIIAGLTSDDSLFSVIDQLAVAVNNISEVALGDITADPDSTMQAVVALNGAVFATSANQLITSSDVELNFRTLSDFDIPTSDIAAGKMLVFNSEAKLKSKKVHYTYENLAESKQHRITHAFGNRYCAVFCIDAVSKKMIIPEEVYYNDNNLLTVEFATPTSLIAILTNIDIY
jgi:hypothetical protein